MRIKWLKSRRKLEEEIQNLKDKLEAEKLQRSDNYISSQKEINELKTKLNDESFSHVEDIKKLNRTIEELRMELDILYKYYRLDEEPTQEVKTQIRIDKRVHELELSNIELRRKIEDDSVYRIMELKKSLETLYSHGSYMGMMTFNNAVNNIGSVMCRDYGIY